MNMVDFQWRKCVAGYRLEPTAHGDFALSSASDWFETTHPLKIETLFAIFAKTPATPEGMKTFCDNYGLLGGGRPDIAPSRSTGTYEFALVSPFLHEQRRFRRAFDLFEKGDNSALVKPWNSMDGAPLIRTELRVGPEWRLKMVFVPPALLRRFGSNWPSTHARTPSSSAASAARSVHSRLGDRPALNVEMVLERLQSGGVQRKTGSTMKGHIRERSSGHWAIVLDIRDPETGKRKRKWHSFAGTKREAQIERSRLVTEFAQGSYVEPSKTTLAAFLDQWLTHIEPQVAPRTHERYEEIARKNVVPLLGQTVLTKLRPEQIAAAYSKALRSGRRDGAGGLSRANGPSYAPCPEAGPGDRRALAHAGAQPGRQCRSTEGRASQDDRARRAETARLLAHFRSTRMFTPVLLAVMCGLRRGEITALRWGSIDLVRRQLSVVESTEQTAKGVRFKETKSGRARTVALPSLVADELRRARLAQAEELLRVGVRLTDQTHVVAQVDGQPLQPNSLTHEFVRLLAKASDLPRIRFHDLRHTHATHLLVERRPSQGGAGAPRSFERRDHARPLQPCPARHAGGRRGQG